MSIDHVHIMNKGEEISFVAGEMGDDLIIKDIELFADTVYVGLVVKSSDGSNMQIAVKVTDGATTPVTYKVTAETDWQEWVDDDKIEVDVSTLTKGNVTVTIVGNIGTGVIKDAYLYQE